MSEYTRCIATKVYITSVWHIIMSLCLHLRRDSRFDQCITPDLLVMAWEEVAAGDDNSVVEQREEDRPHPRSSSTTHTGLIH
jgi:hypothetical protein